MGIKIAVLAVCGIFVFPLMLLVLVQAKNFCSAKTTNERFSKKKPVGEHTHNIGDSASSDSMNGNLLNSEEDPEAPMKHIVPGEPKRNGIVNCWVM